MWRFHIMAKKLPLFSGIYDDLTLRNEAGFLVIIMSCIVYWPDGLTQRIGTSSTSAEHKKSSHSLHTSHCFAVVFFSQVKFVMCAPRNALYLEVRLQSFLSTFRTVFSGRTLVVAKMAMIIMYFLNTDSLQQSWDFSALFPNFATLVCRKMRK